MYKTVKYSNIVKFISKFNDNYFLKKIKNAIINFNFRDRHTPFIKNVTKYFINKKFFIQNLNFDIYDYSHVSQIIFTSYEENHFKFYLNQVRKGEIFIDIGSNIGLHSFFVLKYLQPLKVLSIDPQKLCINLQKKTLSENKKLNSRKIEFINSAVGNLNRELTLFRNDSGSGTLCNDFGKDLVDFNNLEKENITYISIKKIFKKISNTISYKLPHVTIKIDAQGSEFEILNEIYNSNFLYCIKNIIFEVNSTNLNYQKTCLKKYIVKDYRLLTLDNLQVSINNIDNYIKSCLILSRNTQ